MKIRIIAAAIAILTLSFFAACTEKENIPPALTTSESASQTVTETTTYQATFVTTQTTLLVTETATQPTTSAPKTTAVPTTIAVTRVPQTTAVSKPQTTAAGLIYSDSVVEKVPLKYGVVEHRYKTVYFQMINGERVDVGYEYTGGHINRRNFSAEYSDLLPAARQNRETYREYINENLRIINSYRAEKGIAPLRLNEKLTIMACARAEEIAWSGKHSHRRPDGSSCFTIFKDAGFEEGTAGENLGYVYDSPKKVCQAWKDSKTHYENLMNPDFTEIGIGVAADPDERGKLCWANHFLT